MSDTKDWFVSWFNTKYYHTLYKNRDYNEAQLFMQNLVSFLNLKKDAELLDLGCGKGRHAIFLNKLGFDVLGADLSSNSINYAKQFENETLHFYEHDMRIPFSSKFDAIFNLFTSFGFFEEDAEDILILKNIKNGLKDNGVAVIDFMNTKKVYKTLVPFEEKTIDGITFKIHRFIENGFVHKQINFFADNKQHEFIEKVKCIDLKKAKNYMQTVGFNIKHQFGNYQLEDFNEATSDRLILVLE
ncbi:MAG: class I SAM-dependent methyltransferase [Lutibacter sp.]|uniref:class I SAM-dependent methyltransferase n=1 Tax=Lutibacter sp. TaxID=1925666 RepID=UPI00299D8698|nr:class I SAM-dependent methyltransferase [Lutibacter sp.]MDX1828158.1 class I SAM-dependent methyltransferase [Lutibacter sp.]